MKKDLKMGILLLSALIFIGSFITVFVIWFQNPELTSMQMIIKNWGVYLTMFVSAILMNVVGYIRIK